MNTRHSHMNTTLDALDAAAVQAITDRSQERCIVYRNHPLPPGSHPASADLGLESPTGRTFLHVRRGITYNGTNREVATWLGEGTREFSSTEEAIMWLSRHLATASPADQPVPGLDPQDRSVEAPTRLSFDEVTDVEAITLPACTLPSTDALLSALNAEVLGQETAVAGLAELASQHVVKPYPRRPASALLIGPTGTGKTLAAEQLAIELTATTGADWTYRRIDMNEFSEKHSASRLFGAPPGYVGYGDGDDLATALRSNQRMVILFDEIDKAHPHLWHSLMNLMDAGRLATQSDDIDARQAILLFTSNKDARAIQGLTGESEGRKRAFLRERGYPPEIVGRIGRVLVFSDLPPEVAGRLIVLSVQRVVESYGLQLSRIAPEAISTLATEAPLSGGVRDLERHIEALLGSDLVDVVGTVSSIEIDAELTITPIQRDHN